MHRCGSHGNMVGPCSCGSSLSILFTPLPNKISNPTQTPDTDPLASSSMVDCTLSLGTPSTRQTQAISQRSSSSSSSCMSHLCWDMFHSKQPAPLSSCQKSGGARPSSSSSVGDTRLAAPRRCANCDTTSTPLWRNGPRGPKSLCNACGIRYKKEERRATTSALETPQQQQQQQQQHHLINHHQWTYAAQPQRPATALSPAEFRLIEDDGHDGDSSPFLSWRLSVPPPPPDFPVQYT